MNKIIAIILAISSVTSFAQTVEPVAPMVAPAPMAAPVAKTAEQTAREERIARAKGRVECRALANSTSGAKSVGTNWGGGLLSAISSVRAQTNEVELFDDCMLSKGFDKEAK